MIANLRAVWRVLTLALLALFVGAPAWAQITITANDFPGDRHGYSQEMLVGTATEIGPISVEVGSAGENQRWDLTNLGARLTPFTMSIEALSAASLAQLDQLDQLALVSLFPNAQVALASAPNAVTFARKTSAGFLSYGEVGLVEGQQFVLVFQSPLITMQFPLSYGSQWTSRAQGSCVLGGFTFAAEMTYECEVDGWGTVHVPAGEFPCLRIETIQTLQLVDPTTGNGTTNRFIAYDWVTKGAFILAGVQSMPNEYDESFDQANAIYIATKVPIAPSLPVAVRKPAPQPVADPEPEPVSSRNVVPVDPSPAPTLSVGTYHALIIAVQDYHDPSINTLSYPLQDAQNLINALVGNYTLENQNITFLKNPDREQIIDAFDKVSERLTESDNLLIFYAGHGHWDEGHRQGFWLPADAKQSSRTRWLPNSTIQDYIRGMKSKHTLLISDACFSGSIFKTRSAFMGSSRAITELYKLPSRKAMTSGVNNVVPDKSVFVEYLIKRLKENDDPYLSAQDLFMRFREAVINNTPAGISQVPQYGEIRETGDEGGDFVLVRRRLGN